MHRVIGRITSMIFILLGVVLIHHRADAYHFEIVSTGGTLNASVAAPGGGGDTAEFGTGSHSAHYVSACGGASASSNLEIGGDICHFSASGQGSVNDEWAFTVSRGRVEAGFALRVVGEPRASGPGVI